MKISGTMLKLIYEVIRGQTVICKRGQKYVEHILMLQKSCTSLMFCGNVIGDHLMYFTNLSMEVLRDADITEIKVGGLIRLCLRTGLCQSYYGPMKREWQKIVTAWKQNNKSLTNLTKEQLLKQLIDCIWTRRKIWFWDSKNRNHTCSPNKCSGVLASKGNKHTHKRYIGDSFL